MRFVLVLALILFFGWFFGVTYDPNSNAVTIAGYVLGGWALFCATLAFIWLTTCITGVKLANSSAVNSVVNVLERR